MVVNCEQVWREISNYLEGEVNPDLRVAMEAHFRECKHCTAVLDGTRNVIHLYGDDRSLQLPAGFTAGWRRRLTEHMPNPRGTSLGWLLALTAVALVSGSFALARFDGRSAPALRSYHAEPGSGVPDGLMVAVSADGKIFHVPGCRFLHKREYENVQLIAASEAIREGYVPCVRCLRQYLKNQSSVIGPRSSVAGRQSLVVSRWSSVFSRSLLFRRDRTIARVRTAWEPPHGPAL